MKTLTLIISTLFATANLMAQQTVNDTLIIEKPNQIILTQHEDTLNIKVQGQDNKPNFLFEREVVLDPKSEVRTKQTHTTNSPLNWDFAQIEGRDSYRLTTVNFSLTADLNAAWVLPMGTPDDMKFRHWALMEGEFNFACLSIVPHFAKWWYDFKYGFGFQMMEMKKNTMAFTNRDGDLLFGSYPLNTDPKQSVVRSMSMNYTLMAHRRLNQGSSLGFGVTMRNFTNPGSTIRTEYIDTDGKKNVMLDEFNSLRNFQWSAIVQYNYDQNVYFLCRYSPWSPFHPGSGPDYSSFSLGIGLKL